MRTRLVPIAVVMLVLGFGGLVPLASAQDQGSVFKLLCQNNQGTAFLHKSGRLITAAHVVADCGASELILVAGTGQRSTVAAVVTDVAMDLALLTPSVPIVGTPLVVGSQSELQIGAQVVTYGFPQGYGGQRPLLTVGYLAGDDMVATATAPARQRWVVNAAFNGGNSGGPLIAGGSVIGVVSSKATPIPPTIRNAIEALQNQRLGPTFTKRLADGTTETVTEGQVIAEVLEYLRGQTQLVIGHAVKLGDVQSFLEAHNIDP